MQSSLAYPLYQCIIEQQEKTDPRSRNYGLWPSFLEASGHPPLSLGADFSILVALQIMLMLYEVQQKIPFPEFDQIKKRFDYALTQFILDTERSQRTPGFIAFWPYIKFNDNLWKHNFDPHNPVFNHIDIKNDIGNSARAAVYLMKTNQHQEHVANYVRVLSDKMYENGFFTFLPALQHSGGIDVIDNLTLLASLQMLKQSYPHLINKQLLKNEKNTLIRVRKILQYNVITNNMLYFRRPSQFLMAFSQIEQEGFSPFNKNDRNLIRKILQKELKRYDPINPYDFTEQCELLLSHHVLLPRKTNQETIANLRSDLVNKASMSLDTMDRRSLGEYTSFAAGSPFSHTAIYKKFVGWYAPAHAAASAVLYFTLQKTTTHE